MSHSKLITELGLEIRSLALFLIHPVLFCWFSLPNFFIWIYIALKSRSSVLSKPTVWALLAHTQMVFNFIWISQIQPLGVGLKWIPDKLITLKNVKHHHGKALQNKTYIFPQWHEFSLDRQAWDLELRLTNLVISQPMGILYLTKRSLYHCNCIIAIHLDSKFFSGLSLWEPFCLASWSFQEAA